MLPGLRIRIYIYISKAIMSKSSIGNAIDLELPVERGCPSAAPAGYARLREQAPINRAHLVTGPEVGVVSGHEESRAALADRRFSANRGDENFPLVDPDPAARQRFRGQPPVMLSMDGEQHAATRRAVLGEFTMKRLNALEPRIQAIVDGFIDDILATEQRPVDLVQALSLPVPSLVICELLGAPYTDHDCRVRRQRVSG
jgi:cytochrome P450